MRFISMCLAVIGLMTTVCPLVSRAAFQTEYTFESPSTAANVQDTLTGGNNAETFAPPTVNEGPTLTAAAAKHGAVGLDFTAFNPSGTSNDSYLRTQSTSLSFTSGMTVAMWINPSALPTSGNNGTLFWSAETGGGSNGRVDILLFDDGKVRFHNFNAVDNSESVFTNTAFATNTWTHFAATWDDATNTVRLYVNGGLDATDTSFSTLDGGVVAGSHLDFGQAGGQDTAGLQYHGYMDDIYISDSVSSQADILSIAALPEPTSLAFLFAAGALLIRKPRRS